MKDEKYELTPKGLLYIDYGEEANIILDKLELQARRHSRGQNGCPAIIFNGGVAEFGMVAQKKEEE